MSAAAGERCPPELQSVKHFMRILFLSSWFPYPPNNGSKLRIYNLLRGLAKVHEITLLSFADRTMEKGDIDEVQQLCRDVQIVTRNSYQPNSVRATLGILTLTPRSLVDTFSERMKERIAEAVATRAYDLIVASQLGTAAYAPHFLGTPAVFEEVESSVYFDDFTRARSARSQLRKGLTWTKYRLYLARLLHSFDACTVVSRQERQLLSHVAPSYETVEIIPNCVNLAEYQSVKPGMTQAETLIFTGPFGYHANYDAMCWFIEEILPRVQDMFANTSLLITGDHQNLPLPHGENVTLTGFVDDVRPLVAGSAISVVPLRIGGGTRLKILEAMALRTPVVATSKGAEGIDAQHEKHLLLADTPDAFAQATARLLDEPGLANYLVNNAYELVREKYDWEGVMPKFLDLLGEVAV